MSLLREDNRRVIFIRPQVLMDAVAALCAKIFNGCFDAQHIYTNQYEKMPTWKKKEWDRRRLIFFQPEVNDTKQHLAKMRIAHHLYIEKARLNIEVPITFLHSEYSSN